jgi:DNA-binding MarR family transcriptional regulator
VSVVDWMTDLAEKELSLDNLLSASEKGLYIAIKTLRPKSIVKMADLMGLSHSSVSRACANLADRGWVKIELCSREKRVWAVVPDFVQARQAELLSEIYSMQPHKGEFLLKVLLDIHILSRNHVDNVRPRWLINPTTGEPMEIDRLYLPEDGRLAAQGRGRAGGLSGSQATRGDAVAHLRTAKGSGAAGRQVAKGGGLGGSQAVQAAKERQTADPQAASEKGRGGHGFEFHGPQHFGTTNAYPDVEEFRKTQARDLMKKAICADHGVKLVVVTYKDLSPRGILRRIPKTLATAFVDFDGKYMKRVEELCTSYRNNARNLR